MYNNDIILKEYMIQTGIYDKRLINEMERLQEKLPSGKQAVEQRHHIWYS